MWSWLDNRWVNLLFAVSFSLFFLLELASGLYGWATVLLVIAITDWFTVYYAFRSRRQQAAFFISFFNGKLE